MALTLSNENATYGGVDWLGNNSPLIPVVVNGVRYVYSPQSFYDSGFKSASGKTPDLGGGSETIPSNYNYSPAFLQKGIEQSFIPATLSQDFFNKVNSQQESSFASEPDARWRNTLKETSPSLSKTENPEKGFLVPADTFKQALLGPNANSAVYNPTFGGFVTQDGKYIGGAVASTPVTALHEVPNKLVEKNGEKVYASPSSSSGTYITSSGALNLTPNKSGGGMFGGGFLGDLAGGFSDMVGGALGAAGDIAGWALENPLQAAALGAGAYYGLPALAGAGESAAGLSGWDAAMADLAGSAGMGDVAAASGAGAAGLSGWDAAMADLAGSAPMGDVAAAAGGLSALDAGLGAYPTTGAIGAGTAATGGGLLTGAGSTGTGLQMTGTTGLTGGLTENLSAMGGAQGLTGVSPVTGTTLGATGGTLAAGGLGSTIGATGATAGAGSLLGGTAGAGGLGTLGTAALISGGLSTLGGLLQGNTSQKANEQAAAQYAALADKISQMGKFSPVGTTTRFGTSNFTVDPKTGQITGFGYTPSAEMLGYQNRLSALAGQGLTDTEQSRGLYAPLQGGAQQAFGLGQSYLNSQLGTPITSLGQQYLGMSPEQAAQDWMNKQQAVLAASRENQLANVRSNLAQTGRTGLSVAQGGALGASNPELQAYYNALAQQDLGLAASATEQGRAQQRFGADLYNTGQNLTMTGQKFGAGLFGTGADLLGGYYSGVNTALNPYTTSMKGVSSLEEAAQQPLSLSTDLANLVAKSGAAQGANYAKAMAPSIESSTIAAQYNPWATAASGLGSNLLAGYGLAKLFS